MPVSARACHRGHRGVKGLRISVRSTARTLVGTSPIPGLESPKHTASLPVDLLSATFQASVHDTLPEERGRRMEWLPAAFTERLPVLSRTVKCLSALRRMLAPLATVSAHTATIMTMTSHLLMASAVVVTEVAANKLLPVSGPRSTAVLPTA